MINIQSVLLVDDDDISNFVSKDVVVRSGLVETIDVVINGELALNHIKSMGKSSQKPLLVFLDINMPVMDGFEFLEEFDKLTEKEKEGVYIIMLTSSTDESDLVRSRFFPISGYIAKPLSPDKLSEVVDKIY
ncbi:MAG: CheY-like chemotaxis protein [Luteibaculaceae bacterium]|jgi:CheY-like chemotaxis protein